MSIGKLVVGVTAMFFALVAMVVASANIEISDPTNIDRQYLALQRNSLDSLAREKLGRNFSGNKDNDLQILQLLLDRHLVKADQTQELQAMGVILGDLLAAELDMHWVIYADAHGRSRALRYRDSDEYLFPITMISRRREADNHTPVAVIYQKAYDIIAPLQHALPFQ